MLRPGVTLYFVRHGETDWNREGRYQGRRDIPLNATGRAQAKRNGATLAATLGPGAASLDYVSSPLLRASETMEILRSEMGMARDAYRTDSRLAEIHYGHWEGQLWSEIQSFDAAGFAARKLDAWNWQPKGGESFRMVADRVASWLDETRRDTVVAAHGGVSRALRSLVLGLSPADTMRLEVPQDRILVVAAGQARWL